MCTNPVLVRSRPRYTFRWDTNSSDDDALVDDRLRHSYKCCCCCTRVRDHITLQSSLNDV